MAIVKRGGKKGRKTGRNKVKCERYRLADTRLRNKARKLLKRIKKHGGSGGAAEALKAIGREHPSYIRVRGTAN